MDIFLHCVPLGAGQVKQMTGGLLEDQWQTGDVEGERVLTVY